MSHYRIKIEERNNGDKRYIPQVSKLIITGSWIKKQKIVWENIVYSTYSGYISEMNIDDPHKTEKKALEAIEGYKRNLETEKLKEIKSVTYKNI
jgi:hypothetical protein